MAREARFGASNYRPLPVVLTRGEGQYLWDVEGKRYIDMMSAYSAVSFGHGHPRLLRVLSEQAGRLALTSRAFHTDVLGAFMEAVCLATGMDKVLPMNSGAEAVETAIKAARKWGHKVKGIPEGHARIVVAKGNFAGRTTTIISFSSEFQYKDGFGPLTPGFDSIAYGDAKALARAITPATAAFLVEPIQGEGGIIVPPEGYLREVRALCSRHNVLMICDEVQTGLGRTGRLFAVDHEGVKPDAILLGKALGGGLLPVSAFAACAEVMDVFTPGDHGSTFGGNPLAAAVAVEALAILRDERLVERSAELGAHLLRRLRDIRHPAIREVRGRGLLVGVDIDPAWCGGRAFCERLLRRGVLTKETRESVVRMAPPLVIERKTLDAAIDVIEGTLEALDDPRVQSSAAVEPVGI
jgi:ornithine--oxo-acid transaminase